MDLATQRRLINLTAVGLTVLSAASIVWSLGSIDAPPATSTNQSVREPTSNPVGTETVENRLNASQQVDLSLSLQIPLYEPPPRPVESVPKPVVTAKPPPPKAPKLNWVLAGTIIQRERSVAILTDASGKTDVRAAGEVVDLEPAGVFVREVDSDEVTLELNGSRTTLQLDRSFEQSGRGSQTGGQRNGQPGTGRPDRTGRGRNR